MEIFCHFLHFFKLVVTPLFAVIRGVLTDNEYSIRIENSKRISFLFFASAAEEQNYSQNSEIGFVFDLFERFERKCNNIYDSKYECNKLSRILHQAWRYCGK